MTPAKFPKNKERTYGRKGRPRNTASSRVRVRSRLRNLCRWPGDSGGLAPGLAGKQGSSLEQQATPRSARGLPRSLVWLAPGRAGNTRRGRGDHRSPTELPTIWLPGGGHIGANQLPTSEGSPRPWRLVGGAFQALEASGRGSEASPFALFPRLGPAPPFSVTCSRHISQARGWVAQCLLDLEKS